MTYPLRHIEGSAGSRIKVILGQNGFQYLYLLHEDDGDSQWQTCDWTVRLPGKLAKRLDNWLGEGQCIYDVLLGTRNEWFIGGYGWHRSGGDPQAKFKALCNKCHNVQASFGDNDRWIVIDVESNDVHCSRGNINHDLIDRIHRIQTSGGEINFIRLLPGGCYFISDSEGSQWSPTVGTDLSNELKSGDNEPILDVIQAQDYSWIVIRPNRYIVSSHGISEKLKEILDDFYAAHKGRQQRRTAHIQIEAEKQEESRIAAEKKLQERCIAAEQKAKREAELRIAAEKRAQEEQQLRIAAEKRAQEEESRRQNETKKRIREQQHLVDYGAYISAKKRPRVGARVTAKELLPWFIGQRVHVRHYEDATILATKQKIQEHDGEKITVQFDDGTTYYVYESQLEPINIAPFDEYKCIEKIDYWRLQSLAEDLKKDSHTRENCIRKINCMMSENGNKKPTTLQSSQLKKLHRCKELEFLVDSLLNIFADKPVNKRGIVKHEVIYEQRDPSRRGRLFARGEQVHVTDKRKYPRTATLQGMQNDLRRPLVGRFAHDIDCANSEVRLLCSLALQLGFQHLVPTLFDYRDDRETWLNRIQSVHHGVSEEDAKILVNIILSGGSYETWLRKLQEEEDGRVNNFLSDVRGEVSALLDALLRHPRFKWTSIDLDKLYSDGKSRGGIDLRLLPRIVQNCENEVLGIIHRCFFDEKWNVLAKVFDGLIVERGHEANIGLEDVMKKAEARCLSRGWDIQLVEKPLHGMQNEPMATVVEARKVVDAINIEEEPERYDEHNCSGYDCRHDDYDVESESDDECIQIRRYYHHNDYEVESESDDEWFQIKCDYHHDDHEVESEH